MLPYVGGGKYIRGFPRQLEPGTSTGDQQMVTIFSFSFLFPNSPNSSSMLPCFFLL